MQDEIITLKTPANTVEEKLEQIAEKLEVKLPQGSLPLSIRIVTLILIIGGLGILGSVFTDFTTPKSGGVILHFYRLLTGVAFLVIAYFLYERSRWAIWLYGFIVLISLTINFTFALVPSILVIYLYTRRNYFTPCIMDRISNKIIEKIKLKYNSLFNSAARS